MSDQAGMVRQGQSEPLALDWQLATGPQTGRDLYSLARVIAGSGMFPHLGSPPAIFTALRMAAPWGVDPMVALRGVHVIEGRVTMSAGLIEAVVRRSGLAKLWRCTESTTERATYETLREGDPSPISITYSIDDARRAGLAGKKVWQSYPRQMLRARAASELARLVYPDLLAGAYMPDEVSDAAPVDVAEAPPVLIAAATSAPRPRVEPEPEDEPLDAAPAPPAPSRSRPASDLAEAVRAACSVDALFAIIDEAASAWPAPLAAELRAEAWPLAIRLARDVPELDRVGAALQRAPEAERAAVRGMYGERVVELRARAA